MSGTSTHRCVELLKTLMIVILTLSALGLVGRAQLYATAPGASDWLTGLAHFLGEETNAAGVGFDGKDVLNAGLRPARIAVCNESGRCGIQYDAKAVNTAFETQLGSLLGEALAGAGAPAAVTEDAWRTALGNNRISIYYDFLGSVPLSALSDWLGGRENTSLDGDARRFLLAADSSGEAILYFSGGSDGGYYACLVTAETAGRLKTITSGYAPNNAFFAFQKEDSCPGVEPYVMILPEPPAPVVYEASNPIQTNGEDDVMDALLRGLSFHPQTSAVYASADGQVVREGADTLRIDSDGTVTFHASDNQDSRYTVPADGHTPDQGDQVEAARALVQNGLGGWCGEAGFYLMKTETWQDGSVAVYFGYLLDGAAVVLGEGGYAARVVILDDKISDFTLRFRAYHRTDITSAILPETQAAAAMNALEPPGNELLLCYLDSGGMQVTAGWIAR